ncbi:MAG: hypothetical protein IPM29_02425 [Planctomycetes bacterium]|nr:hypothetical protein [Planctomycetota bacterium]
MLALFATLASGQVPTLVRDVNRQPAPPPDSFPGSLFELGGSMYFTAGTEALGNEWYRSDGTVAGTALFGDLEPGNGGFAIVPIGSGGMHVSGGRGYFFRFDFVHGVELWTTDGTVQGTHLVVELVPGSGSPNVSNTYGISINGRFWFHVEDGTTGDVVLFTSDGTAAGTVELLRRPSSAGTAGPLVPFGNGFVFRWSDPVHGLEPWFSDGTVAGTRLVADLSPGTQSSRPSGFSAFGNDLAFSADDGTHGSELWLTDGTAAGTRMIELVPGASGGLPISFGVLGGRLYFGASDPIHGRELWSSDGTQAGTALLHDLSPSFTSSDPQIAATLGGRLVFRASDGVHGSEYWSTDGTPSGAVLLGDLAPGPVSLLVESSAVLGGRLVFSAIGQVAGSLFVTDGTPAGTGVLRNFVSVPGPSNLLVLGPWLGGSQLLLRANDGIHGVEPWLTDGTSAGTQLFIDIATNPAGTTADGAPRPGGNEPLVLPIDDGVAGYEPWITDGTSVGTGSLGDVRPGAAGSGVGTSVALGRRTLLFLDDGVHGNEPWITDGTPATTRLLLDVWPGATGSGNATRFAIRLRDRVLFWAADGVHGVELWATDGTPAGTKLVRDLAPGNTARGPFVRAGERVLFGADSRLWSTDGTDAGTAPIPFAGSNPFVSAVLGDRVLFSASDGAHGIELWSTDGTSAGTYLVRDIEPGTRGSSPGRFAVWQGRAYFRATTLAEGLELWSTDGTPAGTALVADLAPGPDSASPESLTPMSTMLFFSAFSPATGRELYRVAPGGAVALLRDIWPGPLDGGPSDLFASGSRYVWFTAGEATGGRELWRSDGTPAGTSRVVDLRPGPASSDAGVIGAVGSALMLSADDGATGLELWALDPGASVRPVGIPCARGMRHLRLDTTDPVLGQVMSIAVTGAAPSRPGILLLGLPGSAVPIGNGCELLLAAPQLFASFATDPAGAWSTTLPIPALPGLDGLRAAFQAVVAGGPYLPDLESTPASFVVLGR